MLASAPSLIVKPEQVGQQPRQPRERDRLAEAQVEDEGAQVRPERRARLQSGRRRRLEPLGQHGQTPPCNVTRVTSGLISGISMRS